MSIRLLFAWTTAAALLLAGSLNRPIAAKPPDLPAAPEIRCTPQTPQTPDTPQELPRPTWCGFSPDRFIEGLTPAGSFTSDLDIPIRGSLFVPAESVPAVVPVIPIEIIVPVFAPVSEISSEDRADPAAGRKAAKKRAHSEARKERKQARKSNRSEDLRYKERGLTDRLSELVTLKYKDTPIRDVLDDIRVGQNITIVVDMAALHEEEISLDKTVTISLDHVSLKNALELILHQAHLTYVIKDEVLEITTESHAYGPPVLKAYLVEDLVSDNGDTVTCAVLRQLLDNKQTGEALETQLVKLIKDVIKPRSWADDGGPGTIDYFSRRMALVINQTEDVHDQIEQLLAALRRLPRDVGTRETVLFIEPVQRDLIIQEEEKAGTEEQEEQQEEYDLLYYDYCSCQGLDADIEMDVTCGKGVRACCDFQVAGVAFRLLCDKDGRVSFTVSLVAETAPDLRSAQWEHNEQIIRWIETLNEDVADAIEG